MIMAVSAGVLQESRRRLDYFRASLIFAVKNTQRIGMDAPPAIIAELIVLSFQKALDSLSEGGTAVKTAQCVDFKGRFR